MANAKGPYIVKLEWHQTGGLPHPSVTFLEQCESSANAVDRGRRMLSSPQNPQLSCVAAWWRLVGPSEGRECGADDWHLIGRNTVPGGAGAGVCADAR